MHKDAGNEHQCDDDAGDASEVLRCAAVFTMPRMSPKVVRMIAVVASNPKRLTYPPMKFGPFVLSRFFS